ncbi:hypothetical protein RN001_003265 [Aquatica leii]|uniref:Regulator of telomere elongation helicase 1 homolog n=1 Tax=Aquatica leii TaxID=1421715 RepID=A0AAN7SM76_9COLE|nr:hypothetical protein RN001_003265 [Aquatica leii]
MSSLVIRGIPISFPFEPYELQKDYMEKVIECLQNETNGVLESPTGTGKTMSLLCASLAWLTVKRALYQAERRLHSSENEDFLNTMKQDLNNKVGNNGKKFLGMPTIIYASRTHSQISQAMQELKKTAYSHMKAIVIGSRELLCIHPDIIKEEDQATKIHLCQAKMQTRSCNFYNNVDKMLANPLMSELDVVDIEDIVTYGKKHSFCPYFMAKELKQQADIIFMPYNYLLDPRTRKTVGVELSNNVIILDEAHNIERICEDSASLVLTSADITLCIAEITDVMKAMTSEASFNSGSPKDFTAEELCILKQFLLDFEKAVDQVELKNNNDYGGTTFEGGYIFELLKKAGIEYENSRIISNLIEKVVQFLSVAPNDGPFQRKGKGIESFDLLLTLVYGNPYPSFKEKINKCYRVHVVDEEPKKTLGSSWFSKQSTTSYKNGGKKLNFWCFNPGFGMSTLMDTEVRSIILTSGTLAPLKPLVSELEIPLPVQLENPHIVKENQIYVRILDKGPDGVELNSNYRNRDNPEYLSSLGRTILNLSRIIPNGMLIFFPSYPLMQKCQEHWQEQGIWDSIYIQKKIYVEPKRKEAFNTVMIDYYSKVSDPNEKGAIFMGVCRGKISEGLDFADANGRAVLITGLPYAPLKDPRVVLKKKYLDVCKTTNKEMVSGEDWYTLDATRAVNQAIGRVIRHQHDYGAIILLDSRFGSWRIKSQMSRWLRDHVKNVRFFGEIIKDLKEFFRNAEQTLPQAKPFAIKLNENKNLDMNNISITKSGFFDFSTSSVSLSSNNSSSSESRYTERPRSRRVKRKRITISTNQDSSSVLDVPSTDSKEYMAMVKKGLTQNQCTIFINALSSYKGNADFQELTSQLDLIFKQHYNVSSLSVGMNVYFYGVLLIFQLTLMSSVLSRKLQKKSKLSENNHVLEKDKLITARLPVMETFFNKHPGAIHRRIKTQVDPVEESCQSSNFKNEFNTLRQRIKCEPRDSVVDLISPHGAILTPNAVIVKRCGGMCNGFKRCLPVQTKEIKFYIKTIKNNQIHCSSISVIEDVKCRCNCMQTANDCNKLQNYNKDKCSCICRNQIEYNNCINSQNENMIWDENTCSCVCQQNKSCTTGTYWKESECRCIKQTVQNSKKKLLL